MERLVGGALSQESWSAAQEHIATCTECRRLISELARPLSPPESAPAFERTVGRYRILTLLGEGGMGRVFEAYDPKLRRTVAIKVLRDESSPRLLREAQTLARLTHPNIVEIHDIGVDDGALYIAMDLVDGAPIPRWRAVQTRTWSEVVEVFQQAGAGLVAAHRAGIVHRDFKPSNVVVGNDGRVRVLDFGLARFYGDAASSSTPAPTGSGSTSVTATGAVVGTPAYFAPEQYRGDPVDARTDQFAFCVSLFESLYGERPFAGREEVLAGRIADPDPGDVPRRVYRILRRGLAVDPAARWPDMQTLLARLARTPRASRTLWGLAAVGLVALLGVDLFDRPDAPTPAEATSAIAIDPLLAEAHLQRARALMAESRSGQTDLLAAFELAQNAGALEVAALAALELAVGATPQGTDNDPETWRWIGHAEALARRAGEPTGLMLEVHEARGRIFEAQGHFGPARTEFETAVALARTWLPQDSPKLASHLDDLGQTLRIAGEHEAALQFHNEALAIYEGSLGPDHRHTASTVELVGHALSAMGRTEDAVVRYRRALEIRERRLGPEHREVAVSLTNLSGHVLGLGQTEEAVEMLRRALKIEDTHGTLGPATIPLLNNLGVAYRAIDRPREAAEAFARGAEILLERHGADHVSRASLVSGLAQASVDLELWTQAIDAANESLRIRDMHHPDDPIGAFALLALGRARLALGEHARARTALTQARERAENLPRAAPDLLSQIDAELSRV